MELGFIFLDLFLAAIGHRQRPDYTMAVADPVLESPKSSARPR